MTVDYAAIRQENTRRYGTDVVHYGKKLLVDRYDERVHFLLELLQNAEDALRRRGACGTGSVQFELSRSRLRIRHHGRPFDEADVRGICGIAAGTKDGDGGTIGRFGIGFKAVYVFTDRPCIWSGDEAFAIDSYVLPEAIDPIGLPTDQTLIELPFRADLPGAFDEVRRGLEQLGARTLLFLEYVDEIHWTVEDGGSRTYLRMNDSRVGTYGRRVQLLGTSQAIAVDESWLIFDDPAPAGSSKVGAAFQVVRDKDGKEQVQAVPDATLVVYFPTVRPTGLGFFIHGPYSTTPSRDNVLTGDPSNQALLARPAALLGMWFRRLRDLGLWNVQAMRVLPLDGSRFPEGSFFAPLFKAAQDAVATSGLIPTDDGAYATAPAARIARGQDLRALLGREEARALLGSDVTGWVSAELTVDREPALYRYLTETLKVAVVTPEGFVRQLSVEFLRARVDAWILRLYEYLNNQPALTRSPFFDRPILRLTDGTQVAPRKDAAYLPTAEGSGFPTIKPSVCSSTESLAFLARLGIRLPDLVDDLVANVLPKYRKVDVNVGEDEYAHDIDRLARAWRSDSSAQKEKLKAGLQRSNLVRATDCSDGVSRMRMPGDVYIASQRMREMFAGVSGVSLVDDACECLKGEPARDLLVAGGASRQLRLVSHADEFTQEQKRQMRIDAGQVDISTHGPLYDYDLQGLQLLLDLLPELPYDEAAKRARMLWDELCDLVNSRSTGILLGTYHWTFYRRRSHSFAAHYVRVLNRRAWIPSPSGALVRPEEIVFEDLAGPWEANLSLLAQIRFKPPTIKLLAAELGFEPAVLDMLKRVGLTDEASLRNALNKLGIETDAADADASESTDDPAGGPPGGDAGANETTGANTSDGRSPANGSGGGYASGSRAASGGGSGGGSVGSRGQGSAGSAAGTRTFVSYVAVSPEEADDDPDGLIQAARMQLESAAIDFVLSQEPCLSRTPINNPGFDLQDQADDGRVFRRIEVKAMAGSLQNRPVAMSETQFRTAISYRNSFWLYVVENAGTPGKQNVVRICDPAGQAKYFSFDRGWAAASIALGDVAARIAGADYDG